MGGQLHGSCRGRYRGLVGGVAHLWVLGQVPTALSKPMLSPNFLLYSSFRVTLKY